MRHTQKDDTTRRQCGRNNSNESKDRSSCEKNHNRHPDWHCRDFSEHINSFFARASILTHLLQSQLAVPLLYPLNSRSLSGDGCRLTKINNPKWDKETLTYGLAQVAPAITGLSRVATVLRAGHALRYFRGTSSPSKMLNKTSIADFSRIPQFNNNSHPRTRLSNIIKAETTSLHLPKKQQWRMRRPLFETETAHLGWRAHGPPPFIKGTT